ncbi:hypothetical protein BP6252_04510 [Coleophoma cylindrospora]|uniref:Heterokaryon incompatibility domain-containing protein n=1 Tax=Coleophoma cylindrospora TaxID=1849047 RepID=A0A3D8S0N5_9HELO|nr:hypothetical protein BP6252_04510 [Coleophoma cylindrospora]
MSTEPLQHHHSLQDDRKYRYCALQDECDRRIILLEPAAQYDSPLKCRLVNRLWLPEDIRSLNLEQRRAQYNSVKPQWQSSRKLFLDTLQTGDFSQILRMDTTTSDLRRTHRYLKRACEQVDQMVGYDYVAISYAWEDQEPMYELLCDSRIIHITKNVQDVLRRLRETTYSRALWIDSISIDQNNYGEKAVQVRSMDKTYQEARRVIVWLGEDNNSGESVIRVLRSMRDQKVNDLLQRQFLHDTEPDVLRGIRDFLGRTWFHRRWPLQEVVRGRHVTVQCGKVSMDFIQFYHALHEIYSLWKSASGLEYEVIERLRLILRLRMHGPVRSPVSFLGLLVVLHEAACSRPVDRLNSLLGLCGDFTDLIPVFYEQMNGHWCFRKFAHKVLLRDSRNLPAILSCAGAFASKTSTFSWVPDWSVDRQCFPLYLNQKIPGKPHFQEEKSQSLSSGSWRSLTGISIQASMLGTISRNGPVLSPDPSIQELIEIVPKWWNLYAETTPSATYGDFLTVITAGRVDENTPIDTSDRVFDDDVIFDVARPVENLPDPATKHHLENNSTFSSRILRAPVALEITSGPRLNIGKALQSSRPMVAASTLTDTDPSRVTNESHAVPRLTETPTRSSRPIHISPVAGLSSKLGLIRNLRQSANSRTNQLRALVKAPESSSSTIALYQRFSEEELIKLFYVLRLTMGGRCCITTNTGHFGIAPASARRGDIVVDITGNWTCFVLRRTTRSMATRVKVMRRYYKETGILDLGSPLNLHTQNFRLIGDCYLGVPVEVRELEDSWFRLY